MSKKKKTNRYNVFQRQLSAYIKENNLSGSYFREYSKLYSQLDKKTPVKMMQYEISAAIEKYNASKKAPKTDYRTDMPFYEARSEFALPKYEKKTIRVSFNDGGLSLNFKGSTAEFASWFTGDVMAYFRNNYNDSPTAAFILKDATADTLHYEIETMGGSVVGTKSYVPPDKGIVIKDKDFRDAKNAENQQRIVEFIDRKAKLIEQLKSIGYTNEEIREELKKLDDKFYGKGN